MSIYGQKSEDAVAQKLENLGFKRPRGFTSARGYWAHNHQDCEVRWECVATNTEGRTVRIASYENLSYCARRALVVEQYNSPVVFLVQCNDTRNQDRVGVGNDRIFNGRRFEYEGTFSRDKANDVASDYRADGYLARVVTGAYDGQFHVYISQKK